VPIYEYRCPNGHLFEVFKGMNDPAPEACQVCDASPLEIVLHPVAIHYKGSGFYSTDYGRGAGRKGKDDAGASTSTESGGGGDAKKSESSSSSSEPAPKKAAEG
jgi:putative FmdB family regulatory protein